MKASYKAPYQLEKGHDTDSGYDIRTLNAFEIKPMETKLIDTGLFLVLPKDVEVQVRPKSSLSSKGILVHFGTVDAGYRGEVKVAMTNLSGETKFFGVLQKVAQVVFMRLEAPSLGKVDNIEITTSRGTGGFGSTGKF